MATGRVPTTANSPLTAKGDLFGYSTTQARVPVGNNGETLVADSSTSTGLRYQGSMAAGKNAIINGGCDIWQRGTSFASGAQYTADRWYKDGQTYSTVSRQTSGLTGFQYSLRTQRNSGQTGTADIGVITNLETSNSLIFAGQTITVSFWAKAGANFSPTSSRLIVYVPSGTGTDQLRTFASAFTGEASVINTTQVITTTWTRYSFTGSVGSSATQLAVYLAMAGTGTAGANDWFEIAGVQMELGSVATNFTRTGGTIQGELAACQRYYQQGNYGWAGVGSNTTTAVFFGNFPPMRTAPSVGATAAIKMTDAAAADYTQSSTNISINSGTRVTNQSIFVSCPNFTSLTAYRPYFLMPNEGGAIQLSAEL